MSVVEFEAVFQKVDDALKTVLGLPFANRGMAWALGELSEAWQVLNQHRLEMIKPEAAEEKHPTVKTGGYMDFGELDKRVGSIEKRLDDFGISLDPTIPDTITYNIDHRLCAQRKRLDEIERKATEQQVTETVAEATAKYDPFLNWLAAMPDTNQAEEVKAFAELDAPIEVEMRLRELDHDCCAWECQMAECWLQESAVIFHSPSVAETDGNRWLAAFSKQLGVPLVAKWNGESAESKLEPTPPTVKATPIEVKLRVRSAGIRNRHSAGWMWEVWLGAMALQASNPMEREGSSASLQEMGNRWLAALSKELGVTLVARWEGESAEATPEADKGTIPYTGPPLPLGVLDMKDQTTPCPPPANG